jgi:GT2 family glycosyltransferase
LESIRAQTVPDIDVVVVDNDSAVDVTAAVRRRFPEYRVIRSRRNLFFAGAANLGLGGARSPYVAVINDDTALHPKWAESVLATFARDPAIGSVASKVLATDACDRIDSAGDHLALDGRATNVGWNEPDGPRFDLEAEVFSPAGACAAYRSSSFFAAGGFDSDFVAYLEDIDLGFRLQLIGARCIYNPRARASHVGGATSKGRLYALRLAERNMVWNLLKNMPDAVVRSHGASIRAAQGKPAPMVGGSSWLGWSLGKAAAGRGARSMLKKRRRIQGSKTVSDRYVETLLSQRRVTLCHL